MTVKDFKFKGMVFDVEYEAYEEIINNKIGINIDLEDIKMQEPERSNIIFYLHNRCLWKELKKAVLKQEINKLKKIIWR